MNFYYVYALLSEKDGYFYIGYTNDLRKRITEHERGKVHSTKSRLPAKLVYYEACLNQQDATRREKYLKSSWGKRYLKNRMPNYLAELGDAI
jgi:putative endonuclease